MLSKKQIANLIERKDLTYNLRSGSLLQLPTAKTTTYGTSSLAFRGSILWNSLPDTIKDSPCINKFKLLIKNGRVKTVNVKIGGSTTSMEILFDVLFMLIFNFVQVVL